MFFLFLPLSLSHSFGVGLCFTLPFLPFLSYLSLSLPLCFSLALSLSLSLSLSLFLSLLSLSLSLSLLFSFFRLTMVSCSLWLPFSLASQVAKILAIRAANSPAFLQTHGIRQRLDDLATHLVHTATCLHWRLLCVA